MAASSSIALPIDAVLPDIVAALSRHQFVVLEAPPGAGKTTRVPLALERLAPGDPREVVVTEPRRLAARLSATFVANELGTTVGDRVGYSVRHDEKRSARTRIRYVTEGTLLGEFARDPGLANTRAVLLDEFHERHVESDALLALLLRLAQRRADLRVVVMSATLDGEPIARFLEHCPRITSEGRQYPLTIEYDTELADRPLEKRISLAVKKALRARDVGNVLVFLPGANEIARASEQLATSPDLGVDILPLHGELPLAEQARAVQAANRRRVVLSTNVAESSVTVHGVSTVIDSGLARVASFSPWTGRKTLALSEVSQGSCVQRGGRAGRTGPGHVIRLYSEASFKSRPKAAIPEIQRADLTEALLLLASLDLAFEDLAWLDAPPEAAVRSARELLSRLGALEDEGGGARLSALGRRLARLPLPARLARVVVAAEDLGIAQSGALAAALLSLPEIRERDPKRDVESGASDVQDRMDAFREAQDSAFSGQVLRALGLRPGAVHDVKRVLGVLCRRLPEDQTFGDDAEGRLNRALLAGFPDCVARRQSPSSNQLILYNGTRARLSPGSVVHTGTLLLALDVEERSAERPGGPSRAPSSLVEVRLACTIDPDWLLSDHAARVEPREELVWNQEQQRVDCVSKLSYGSVTLDESRSRAPASSAASQLLCEKVAARLCQSDAVVALRERLRLLKQHGLTDEALPSDAEFIHVACEGRVSASEIDEAELGSTLRQGLAREAQQLLFREAPESIRLPHGTDLQIHYEPGKPPWVASRLQDFFGMKSTPTLCRGRQPLVLHLLAPNQRAVQVTSDLEGFWQRHYPELRKQLGRRYPKHSWPEDGATATPPPTRPPRR